MIERSRLDFVLVVFVGVFLAAADGPADLRRVGLVPPTVEDREVQAAVGEQFHAAGPAGLVGPAGRVEPYVAALDEIAGHGDVVILKENDMAPNFGIANKVNHLADQVLAGVVMGVGLAG